MALILNDNIICFKAFLDVFVEPRPRVRPRRGNLTIVGVLVLVVLVVATVRSEFNDEL